MQPALTAAAPTAGTAHARGRTLTPQALVPYLFLLPAFVFYGFFLVYPMLSSLYVSFFRWDGLSADMVFVGLGILVFGLLDSGVFIRGSGYRQPEKLKEGGARTARAAVAG